MTQGMSLGERIEERASELEEVASALADGNLEKTTAALVTLIAGLATGHAELAGLLAPFVHKGVQVAFASTATRRLRAELAKLHAEDERRAFIAAIAEPIEVLLGQALLQLVRTQHQASDAVTDALGGLRADLRSFRAEFSDRLEDDGVRVDTAHVLDGGTGVRVRDGARARVWIGELTVTGAGSIGIHVGRH
jgi:hypothetical protein